MKYLARVLLILVAATPAAGQSPQFVVAPPASTFDMQRHPADSERLIPDSPAAAAKNTLNWNAINDRIHMGAGGIRDDVYLPAGLWYHDGALRIGINAESTRIRAGGSIHGAGGFGSQLNTNSIHLNLGAETRLINTSTVDRAPADGFTDGASLLYGGFGWRFGNFSVWGFDIPSQDAWFARNTKPQKQAVGLRMQASSIPGPPNASFVWIAPITFMGFHDAILFQPKTGTMGQANNTYWQFIGADTCDTIFHLNDDQAFTHQIYALYPGEHCDRGIFMERGGDIHVYSMEVVHPNFTVAEIGDFYHHNHGELVIDDLKLDNNANTGTVLLKLGRFQKQLRSVFITGSVGPHVKFDAAGACQGIQPTDRIFIRFTGDPKRAAYLNSFSTIDASGNY
ncbi:MAG: hypothetical protein AB7G28_21070, partial [Pirellulales bacterium]